MIFVYDVDDDKHRRIAKNLNKSQTSPDELLDLNNGIFQPKVKRPNRTKRGVSAIHVNDQEGSND